MFSAYELINGFDNTFYTRSDVKTRSFTLLDGFLISESLRRLISNVHIAHDGDNVSDHSPVLMDLNVEIWTTGLKTPLAPQYVNWRKLTSDSRTLFREEMSRSLNSINVPFHTVLHGDKCCVDDTRNQSFQKPTLIFNVLFGRKNYQS